MKWHWYLDKNDIPYGIDTWIKMKYHIITIIWQPFQWGCWQSQRPCPWSVKAPPKSDRSITIPPYLPGNFRKIILCNCVISSYNIHITLRQATETQLTTSNSKQFRKLQHSFILVCQVLAATDADAEEERTAGDFAQKVMYFHSYIFTFQMTFFRQFTMAGLLFL